MSAVKKTLERINMFIYFNALTVHGQVSLNAKNYCFKELAFLATFKNRGISAEIRSISAGIQGISAQIRGITAKIQGNSLEIQVISAEIRGISAGIQGISAEILGISAASRGISAEIQGISQC